MLLLILSLVFVHPFHVSVTEVAYKQNTKALHITQRIFFDDLEKGIQEINGNDEYRLQIPLDSIAKAYLISQSTISVHNRKALFLGVEEDQDLVWVYFELENVQINNEITFHSKLLTRTFEDQENLVHFRLPGGKETYRLNVDREKVSIRVK
jgi:hypothetical protein